MHHHHRLRPRPNPLFQLRKIDPPPMVIKKRIALQPHILEVRQKIKQRIARLRHQHLIARVAQQPEQIPIPLAGARRQHQRSRVNTCPVVRVILCHGLSRRSHPTRIRVIHQSPRLRQRPQDRLGIVLKPTHRRVRYRQIDQPPPRRPSLADRSRKSALPHIPTSPSAKTECSPNHLNRRRWDLRDPHSAGRWLIFKCSVYTSFAKTTNP